MPDTWEYPWFAAWDLAFHAVAAGDGRPRRSPRSSSTCCSSRRYLHPNGQMPAYEWNFSDVNPPVHAWATYFVYELEKARTGTGDRAWLENAFHKLAKNFTWWLNRKDADGRNVFQGGFLGLDNIGVFDRSAPLPTGGHLDQADGTAWMALYCQNMLQIALELAEHDPVYVEQAQTFLEHFAWIAAATNRVGAGRTSSVGRGGRLLLRRAAAARTAAATRLKVRSMVGLLPLAAATVLDADVARPVPRAGRRGAASSSPGTRRASRQLPSAAGGPRAAGACSRCSTRRGCAGSWPGCSTRRSSSARTASGRCRGATPSTRTSSGSTARSYRVAYLPAESDTGMFGGNSNWRGPVWFPINALLIRALLNLYAYYGDEFTRRVPDRLGQQLTLYEVAREISRPARLGTFLPRRRRPAAGLRRPARCSRTTRTGATCCCSTSTSTATTAPASAPATRPAGPAWSRVPTLFHGIVLGGLRGRDGHCRRARRWRRQPARAGGPT